MYYYAYRVGSGGMACYETDDIKKYLTWVTIRKDTADSVDGAVNKIIDKMKRNVVT